MTLACNSGYTKRDGGNIVPRYIKIGCSRLLEELLSDDDEERRDWTFAEHHPATADAIAFAQILAAVPFHNENNPWLWIKSGTVTINDDVSPPHTLPTNEEEEDEVDCVDVRWIVTRRSTGDVATIRMASLRLPRRIENGHGMVAGCCCDRCCCFCYWSLLLQKTNILYSSSGTAFRVYGRRVMFVSFVVPGAMEISMFLLSAPAGVGHYPYPYSTYVIL